MSTEKKNSNEDLATSVGMFIGKGVLIFIAVLVTLAATLAIALAKEGKLLKEEGYLFSGIVRKKLRFLLGIVPFALVAVMLAGYMKVDSLTDFGVDDNPKTEGDFRNIVEKRQGEHEDVAHAMEDKRNDLRYAKEEREEIKRDFHAAKHEEERSLFEENFLKMKRRSIN